MLVLIVGSIINQCAVANESLVLQWKKGLSGAKLTAYNGSVISSNSSLTVINFCSNGRYSFYKEGGWFVPGAASGASNQTIYGQWDVKEQFGSVVLTYLTDQGLRGQFALYLQRNGRVNIGGAAYSVQKNSANCSF